VAQRMTPRDRMVSSAIQLFRERGVAGTALSDVVEHSGAPRGSIYHYFPDGKAQLATEATELAGRLMTRLIEKSMAAQGPAGSIAAIVEVTRRQLLDTDFASGCPIAAGALEGGGAPEARAAAGSAFASWEAALSTALREHGTPPDRAAALATLIICAIEGAIILAKAQRSTQPLDRVEAELHQLLRSTTAGG
jgi:TetR/AcrR family transcriptional regulator, lmrAB and yxaGH operons repressor